MTDLRPNPCPACRRRPRDEPSHRLRSWCVHESPGRARGVRHRASRPGTRRDRPLEPVDRPLMVYLFDPYCPGPTATCRPSPSSSGGWGPRWTSRSSTSGSTRTPRSPTPLPPCSRSSAAPASDSAPRRQALADGSMTLSSRDAAAAVVALLAAAPSRPIDVLWAAPGVLLVGAEPVRPDHRGPHRPSPRARRRGGGLSRDPSRLRSSRTRTSASRATSGLAGPTLLVSHGDQLSEFEGPGASGDHLLQQFRSVLARP